MYITQYALYQTVFMDNCGCIGIYEEIFLSLLFDLWISAGFQAPCYQRATGPIWLEAGKVLALDVMSI